MRRILNFSSLQEMQHHAKENHLSLFVYKKCVYNLTEFIEKHPGGQWEIKQFENQSIDEIIFDKKFHRHNPEMMVTLLSCLYGYIEGSSKPVKKKPQSSQQIIAGIRNKLRETVIPEDEAIPEDCSIEEIPLQTIRRRIISAKTTKY